MQDPKTFYEERLGRYSGELAECKKKGLLLAMLRLMVFVITTVLIYFFHSSNIALVTSIVVGLTVFLILVNFSGRTVQRRCFLEKIIQINEVELRFLNGNLDSLVSGDEYINSDHAFNSDIDLFGPGSIFQHINRTPLKTSRDQLAKYLNANQIDNIGARQSAIQELTRIPDWRQKFETNSSLIEKTVESSDIGYWLQNYKTFVPPIFKILPTLFFILSLVVIGCYAFSLVGELAIVIQLLIGLGITGIYFKKITLLHSKISTVKETLKQFSHSLSLIENHEFDSDLLKKAQEKIRLEGKSASSILAQLASEINNLDQRGNILFAPLADGFALWELRYSWRIEQWIQNFENTVEDWFEVIDQIHAYNSMANYSFNHPDYVYPTINSKGNPIIDANCLGHPTLDPDSRITNKFQLNKNQFFIITGANMAGKSTFLRMIGVSVVMANSGLPLCASSFSYTPIKLISSMRTSDSLHKNESYFFSELKRLQYVGQEIMKDEYLVILDEILKGTNSADKEEGSKKFVEKLLGSKSTGIIATHDLSLCELEQAHDAIFNYYFDARIEEDDLLFDYLLKPGICQNMNASFLLRKMGIV